MDDFIPILCSVAGAILVWGITAENLFYKRRDRD
jgi:hypothetical protein